MPKMFGGGVEVDIIVQDTRKNVLMGCLIG